MACSASTPQSCWKAYWTVEGDNRERQVPARLQNVLNLQSVTMMIDLILGPGLVLHAIRSLPLGSERVQIVLQGRRDPHNRGYVYLESLTGNSVRYATRLGIERDSLVQNQKRRARLGCRADRRAPRAQHHRPARRAGPGDGRVRRGRKAFSARATPTRTAASASPPRRAATSRRWPPSGTPCSSPAPRPSRTTATAGTCGSRSR